MVGGCAWRFLLRACLAALGVKEGVESFLLRFVLFLVVPETAVGCVAKWREGWVMLQNLPRVALPRGLLYLEYYLRCVENEQEKTDVCTAVCTYCVSFFFLFPARCGMHFFSSFFFPLLFSVVCPTGPHPPLRLGRRPNRGHIGGGGLDPLLRYVPMMFFIASGFSTSTLVDREAM